MKTVGFEECKHNRDERGFSLIEVLVVVTILGIMAGGMVWSYVRKGDADEVQKEGATIASLLREARAASLAVGRDVNVLIRKTPPTSTDPHIRAYVDRNYTAAYESATDELIKDYRIQNLTKVQVEYTNALSFGTEIAPPSGWDGQISFKQRGDSLYNDVDPLTRGTAPRYDKMKILFLRLTTAPTAAATTLKTKWVSFGLFPRAGSIIVFPGWCNNATFATTAEGCK